METNAIALRNRNMYRRYFTTWIQELLLTKLVSASKSRILYTYFQFWTTGFERKLSATEYYSNCLSLKMWNIWKRQRLVRVCQASKLQTLFNDWRSKAQYRSKRGAVRSAFKKWQALTKVRSFQQIRREIFSDTWASKQRLRRVLNAWHQLAQSNST